MSAYIEGRHRGRHREKSNPSSTMKKEKKEAAPCCELSK